MAITTFQGNKADVRARRIRFGIPAALQLAETHITAVANNKGGVGKSQLVVQLAAALARLGFRVLVCDMDPQANTTRRLGIEYDPNAPIVTMSEVVKSGERGIGQGAVLPCGWIDSDGNPTSEAENIDLIPSRFDLINRETEAGQVGAVRRLKRALEGWTDEYDIVLIDTPPSLGHLVQMALAVANTVLIPSDATYDSVEAAIRLRDFVQVHAEDLANPGLHIGGVVTTRYKRSLEAEEQVAGAREHFGDLLLDPTRIVKEPGMDDLLLPRWIPEWVRLTEADSAAVSVSAWSDRQSRKTVALYDSVAAEYINKVIGEAA
ncbi:ParA family protein [Microbacterium sp. NPDC055665]